MNNEAESIQFSDLVLKSISNYFLVNPREYTYVGIGSVPRFTNLDEFTSRYDQIIPEFVRDIIKTTTKTINIIHFDPRFDHVYDFMLKYFESSPYDLQYNPSEQFNRWVSRDHRIEITILNINFYQQQNWFYHELIKTTLANKYQLVVQQYTGSELYETFKYLYEKNPNKALFKQKILFDITYGSDCHCDTDMDKYKPYYDPDGNFYNLLLLNGQELYNMFGIHPEINTRIQTYYIKEYKSIVNKIHVDYRRKIQNITIANYKDLYDNNSTSNQIMEILYNELQPSIMAFQGLNLLTPEKQQILNELFQNYKDYGLNTNPSVYKWTERLYNLF